MPELMEDEYSVTLRNGEEITVTVHGAGADGWLIPTLRAWDDQDEVRVWEVDGTSLDDLCWDIVAGLTD